MEANFLFWKISSQASLKQFLNFSYEKMDHVIYSPPPGTPCWEFQTPQHESTFCS